MSPNIQDRLPNQLVHKELVGEIVNSRPDRATVSKDFLGKPHFEQAGQVLFEPLLCLLHM